MTDSTIDLQHLLDGTPQAEAPRTEGQQVLDHEEAFPATRLEGWLITLVFAAAFFAAGYFTIVHGHIVQFGAMERLADAYMAWWNDPPKLSAIGLGLAPVGTLVFLVPALIKPFATSLTALPLITAIAAGATLAMLNSLMARCSVGRIVRWLAVLLVAVNPMFVFYAGSGSPEALGVFVAACSLLAIISWRVTDETRYLVGAGLAIGVAVMVDYTYLAWALALMLTIAFVGPGPRAGQTKLRSSLLLFLTPIFYSVLIWTILNGVILDSPFQWLEIGTFQPAANLDPVVAQASAQLGPALGDMAQVVLGVAPLAFVAVPLLAISAFGRRDSLGFGLITVAVAAVAAIVLGALLEDRAGYVALATGLSLVVVAIAAVAWLYRVEPSWRFVLALVLLAGLGGAIPLSWHAMQTYEYQDQEQAFTRLVETRDSQEGTSSLGGYKVGIDPELAMADYIDNNLKPPKNSILTDSNATYGVVLTGGRPDLFVDRADYSEGEWLTIRDHPFGKVRYMLVANAASGDLIRARYPGLDLGAQPGLVPIFHTDRYVLVQLEPGVVPAASVADASRLRNQPRLITPRTPLSPPPVRRAPPSEAGLSPLPEASAAESTGESGISSAPKVEGE
jgi:hypothetical protein